jgi:molybdenum cofactor cytidylyltransferase
VPERACAAVVLAAGASTRLGQAKQLVSIDGEPLLLRTVRLAREAGCAPIVVVIGFEAERMRAELADAAVIAVTNEAWESGMGSSLRCGIAALDGVDPRPLDALLLVCDQTALGVDVLREVRRVHARGERPITACCYAGHAGVPAIFSSRYFPELLRVEGDRGARGVLERHDGDVAVVAFDGGVEDLDTPEQLGDLDRLSG